MQGSSMKNPESKKRKRVFAGPQVGITLNLVVDHNSHGKLMRSDPARSQRGRVRGNTPRYGLALAGQESLCVPGVGINPRCWPRSGTDVDRWLQSKNQEREAME